MGEEVVSTPTSSGGTESAGASSAPTSTSTPPAAAAPVDMGVALERAMSGATPDPQTPPAQPVQMPGPLPYERHKAILDGAYKERDTLRQQFDQYKQQHGWVESVPREHWQMMSALTNKLAKNPLGFTDELMAQLMTNPQYTSYLRSLGARLLGNGRGAPQEPGPDLDYGEGRTGYSAAQMQKLREWDRQRLASEFDQKLQPLLQDQQDRQKQQEWQRYGKELAQRADQTASVIYQRALKWPHFEEIKKDIAALMTQHQEMELGDAYAYVMQTKVLPSYGQRAVTSATAKLAAGTDAPGRAAGTTPKSLKDMNMDEKFEHFMKVHGAG